MLDGLNGRGPVVVKLGGAAIDDAGALDLVCGTLARLHRQRSVAGDVPRGLVVVHGGGAAVDEHLARLGMASARCEGLRVTPPEQIEEVVAVLAGKVNKRLVGALARAGAPAVGLCLGDGGLARVRRATGPVDLGCVGTVTGGDGALLALMLAHDYVPVLCSIGLDEQGAPLNVNADMAAAGIAGLVGAARVVLLTDVEAVLDGAGAPIDELGGEEIEALIASGVIRGGMIAKARSARALAEEAGRPVTIASWKTFGDVDAAAGTSIVPAAALARGGVGA